MPKATHRANNRLKPITPRTFAKPAGLVFMQIDKETLETILTRLQEEKSGFIPPPQPRQLFIRLPKATDREVWSGSGLNYWKLRRLISPGWWNDHRPPVKAHKLVKPNKRDGVVLIDYCSLLKYIGIQILDPLLPPYIDIPDSKDECPFTGLKSGILYQLSKPYSPYGRTGLVLRSFQIPGNVRRITVIETTSLVNFIRSQKPPNYKIDRPDFSRFNGDAPIPEGIE